MNICLDRPRRVPFIMPQATNRFHDYKRGSFQRGLTFKLVLVMWHMIVSGIEDCSWKIPWRGISENAAQILIIKLNARSRMLRGRFSKFLFLFENWRWDWQMRIWFLLFLYFIYKRRKISFKDLFDRTWQSITVVEILFFFIYINLTVCERKNILKNLIGSSSFCFFLFLKS